jgi:predicted alpha/beta hydrolase
MDRPDALARERLTPVEPSPPSLRSFALPARDGYPLGACLFEPPGAARGTVVLGPATGVPARFYHPLGKHLAREGYRALTFDYRGVGRSAPPSLRGFHATFRLWAELDLAAAVAHAAALPGPAFVVGHSMSGQLLGLVDGIERVAGAYLVASQTGSYRVWSGHEKALLFTFWHLLLPGVTSALGYFPGKLMGNAEDLPRGAALEWARWGRHPDYLLGELPAMRARYASLRFPLRVVSLEGDFYAPLAGVDRLAAWYAGADLTRFHVHEPDYPARRIGHFGFFRPELGGVLWPDLLAFLRAHDAPAP